MPHMMEKVLSFKITYMNGIRYYPNFGSVRTVNFTCDMYANDSLHGVCFPTELAAQEKLIFFLLTYLRTIQDILMTCWLSGERSLPFGLLVYTCRELGKAQELGYV